LWRVILWKLFLLCSEAAYTSSSRRNDATWFSGLLISWGIASHVMYLGTLFLSHDRE
jgi:hypothetical protein